MSMLKVDSFLSVFCIFDILILSHNKEGVDTNEKFYNMVNCNFWFYVLGI